MAQSYCVCKLCNKEFSKAGVLRHLSSCMRSKGTTEAGESYIIRVEGKYNKAFWLYLLVDDCVRLEELDQYLGDIWLDCCGHLSSFYIDGEYYNDVHQFGEQSMAIQVKYVFKENLKIKYEYDFGSTTELSITVLKETARVFDQPGIYLLARNNPPAVICEKCESKDALLWRNLYDGDETLLCPDCAKVAGIAEDESIEEDESITEDELWEHTLLCNSPRAGVCVYNGPATDILFLPHREKKQKNVKKDREHYDDGEVEGDDEYYVDDVERFSDDEYYYDDETGIFDTPYLEGNIDPDELKGNGIYDFLSIVDKDELMEIGRIFDIKGISNKQVNEIALKIGSFILNNLKEMLTYMPRPFYDVFLKVVKDPTLDPDELSDDETRIVTALQELGLVFVSEDDYFEHIHVPNDVMNLTKELTSKGSFMADREDVTVINRNMVYCLFQWGVTEFGLLLKTVKELSGVKKEREGWFSEAIMEIINFQILLGTIKITDWEGKTYLSCRVFTPEDILKDKFWQDSDYAPLHPETKDFASYPMSYIEKTPSMQRIYKILSEEGDEEEAETVITLLMFSAMNSKTFQAFEELALLPEGANQHESREMLKGIYYNLPNYWRKGAVPCD